MAHLISHDPIVSEVFGTLAIAHVPWLTIASHVALARASEAYHL